MTTVLVRALRSIDDLRAAADLFGALWRSPAAGQPLRCDLLRALEMSGNYVHGAFEPDGRLVGACVGWAEVPAPGEPAALHSHVAGVAPDRRRAGIGLALKLDQREWALRHGMSVITWTFDPLVRRNAIFNLSRLGARAVRYVPDCYGPLPDAINRDDASDRLVVDWELESPTALDAVRGRPYVAVGDRTHRVPDDVEALRHSDPAAASAARLATREILGGVLAAGGGILGVDEAGDYVLSEGPA